MSDENECALTLKSFLTGGCYARHTLLPRVMVNVMKEYSVSHKQMYALLDECGVNSWDERRHLMSKVK